MKKIETTILLTLLGIVIGWSVGEMHYGSNPRPFILIVTIIIITTIVNVVHNRWRKFDDKHPEPQRKLIVRDSNEKQYDAMLFVIRNQKYITVLTDRETDIKSNQYHISINPFVEWKYKS